MKLERIFLISAALAFAASFASGCASGRAVVKRTTETQPATERHEVFFEFNKSEIRSEDRDLLGDVANKIENDPKAVAILEGHADQIGEADYNEILAESRARSVRVYLRDLGADPRRLTITSKGEREPLVEGRSQTALERNRRVEIFLTLTGASHD
ncbi:MAG TPA: OmpA family protein [bacterium]|nr:OmpA family protein [bacterium]